MAKRKTKASRSSQVATAQAAESLCEKMQKMAGRINRSFPPGSKVEFFRSSVGRVIYRVTSTVSKHQFPIGNLIQYGLNVELADWQIKAMQLNKGLVFEVNGRLIYTVPWACIYVDLPNAVDLSQQKGDGDG